MVDIELLSDEGAHAIISKILIGLENFVNDNPTMAKVVLDVLVYDCVDPLSADDFFGTEGWEHAFGIED